ncbi:hypothetical protein BH24ACT5_BH24ACT5_31090 [soil metagenome]
MTSIGVPLNARSRRTRRALLDAARQQLEHGGFDALTMASAAEAAGVSRRAGYLHFSSRAELLAALYRHLGETEELAESLARVWACGTAVDALDEWAHHIARAHPRILAVSRAVERSRATDADAARLWDTTMRNWHKGCTRLAGWLQHEGSLAAGWTVAEAADLLWGLMSWDLLERMISDCGWDHAHFGTRLAAVFRVILVPAGR